MARLTRTAWELEDGLQPLVALAGCGSVENGMGSIAGRGGRPRCGRVGNPLHRQHGGARSPARGRGKKSTQQAEQLGRSRGGLTTKIHARVDGAGRLFTLLLTPEQQHDSTVAQQLMQQGCDSQPTARASRLTSRLPVFGYNIAATKTSCLCWMHYIPHRKASECAYQQFLPIG